MRITEVNQPSLKAIRESLEQSNTTGISNEDLMKIAEQHLHGSWSEGMSADEAYAHDMEIIGEEAIQIEAKDAPPAVIFKTCAEYVSTLAKWAIGNPAVIQKIQEFRAVKTANPMQPFGKNDSRLISTGPLGRAVDGLRHVHLTQDLSLFYTLSGSKPQVFHLYGIYSHNESGTGNSPNIKVQKNLGKRLSNQTFM
jgi:hypothetical protein